ncbi:MAG: hypothetical protein WCP35_09660, partial [Verrucomicrobiota bacterium]
AMTATGAITLNDTATDVLSVGANASFSGATITIGAAGIANFGSLTLNSPGAVSVQEDSDTQLANTSVVGSLNLITTGTLTDANGTSLIVTSNATMTAPGVITLNDIASDVLNVGGNASFSAPSINIGPAGTANFGTLTFSAPGVVSVLADSSCMLVGINTASNLVLGSSGGSIQEDAAATLTVPNLTTLSALGNIVLTNNNNSFNRLTVVTAANVAIKDNGNTNGANQGLMLVGTNHFTGTGFVIATTGGMRLGNTGPGQTTISGSTVGGRAILIAGAVQGVAGVNEFSGNVTPPETISEVVPIGDFDGVATNTYIFANSLQNVQTPLGSYIRPINSAGDPVRNLQFNFGFGSSGSASVDGILADFGVNSLGNLQGLNGDTAVFFTGAPFVDIAISDAAELARSFLKKVAKDVPSIEINSATVGGGAVDSIDRNPSYYGPFWTIGYQYEEYDKNKHQTPFPLYYYRATGSEWSNLLLK